MRFQAIIFAKLVEMKIHFYIFFHYFCISADQIEDFYKSSGIVKLKKQKHRLNADAFAFKISLFSNF